MGEEKKRLKNRKGDARGVNDGARKTWFNGTPGPGRPLLPEEIKKLKTEALQAAIVRMHEIMTKGEVYRMARKDEVKYLETAFDRFGLPKVVKEEISGPDNGPIKYTWED